MYKIVIIDDDVAVTNYLMVFLMQTGAYETTIINDSRQIPELLEKEDFDVMLLDMDMPNISGFEILKMAKDKGIDTPVIILTGVPDVNLAVDSMKLGAFDYLTKPVEDNHLLDVLDNAIQHQRTRNSLDDSQTKLSIESLEFEDAFDKLPTQDPQMIRIFHLAEKMALSDLNIFIWGEIGTGKLLLAQAIHKASPRSKKPFISVNASAEDPVKFPAIFFGQAKDWSGAKKDTKGLIEDASDGTLFLDEIDSLTLPMQTRLRRAIQAGECYREGSTKIRKCNVRFIVSSNYDLTSREYSNLLQKDLLYHLLINSLRLPPLRERSDDIPLVAEYYLKRESKKVGKKITGFSDDVMNLLQSHSFPNNLRELRHIVATMVMNEDTSIITMDSLTQYLHDLLTRKSISVVDSFTPRPLKDVELEHVEKMLGHFGNDENKTADELGISLQEMNQILENQEQSS